MAELWARSSVRLPRKEPNCDIWIGEQKVFILTSELVAALRFHQSNVGPASVTNVVTAIISKHSIGRLNSTKDKRRLTDITRLHVFCLDCKACNLHWMSSLDSRLADRSQHDATIPHVIVEEQTSFH
uniref:Uncharacterized protein n=1 Tax=Steinernema glaseri TaxID=37863 RepID=A0A1I8AGX5_9BILA